MRLRMRSLRIIAERINTIIGVHHNHGCRDRVRLNPLKKVSMLKATPKNAAAIIRGKSLRAIFSFGINNQDSQNKIMAPLTRNKIKHKHRCTVALHPLLW
jgi:hypothetical protein